MFRSLIFSLFIMYVIPAFSQNFTLTHDGISRSYRLHLPPGYSPDSLYPLVINMHGLGSNAVEQEFYSEFNPVGDSNGIIVAYPNGLNETWNVSSPSGTDDVGFISALIDTVNLTYNIDLERVYACGMSMGGFMSYRLACELSDRIAAIASVTGLQAFNPCTPSRPVPVAQFHGTADPIVPYAGVPTTIANWVGYNGCPMEPVVTDLPDIDTNDNSTVTLSYYGLCNNLSEVLLYTINNGEHTWPGASFIIGVTNQDIHASVEIWNFFKKYTLQGSTGIDGKGEEHDFAWQIYPNPVSSYAVIETKSTTSVYNVRIYGITGVVMFERNGLTEQKITVDFRNFPPGMYIAELASGNKKHFRKVSVR